MITHRSLGEYFFSRSRYILVKSVEETFRDLTSAPSVVTGSNAKSSSEPKLFGLSNVGENFAGLTAGLVG